MSLITNMLLKHWTKIRARGRADFIIRYGVLGWGISAAVLTIVFIWLMVPTFNLKTYGLFYFGIFPVMGIPLAFDWWRQCERGFQR